VSALVAIDALVLAPVLAPAAGAVAVLVADVVAPRLRVAHYAVGVLALLAGILLALPGAVQPPGDSRLTLCLEAPEGACLYAAGPLASALQVAALASALVVLLLVWPPRQAPTAPVPAVGPLRGGPAVLVALVLAATAGAAAVAAAQDLGSWLVALELATLPAIALVALRGTREAGAGAVALLTTSLVSFAMVVLGAALWLAATGEALFSNAAAGRAVADPADRAVLALSVLLLVGGLGFKLSLVPFHAWTPQAYAGGAEPVAAFLAATSKVAALAALLVVLRPLTTLAAPVVVAVAVLAAASMTVGNLLALVQDDPVRLLAWSTVAQAGWVVLPLATLAPEALSASGGYLIAYVIATLAAFCVVVIVREAAPGARGGLAAYRGLLRSRPLLGACLALALVSLAGLPPGVLGLVAKVVALQPVVASGMWLLALAAVANAVLGIAVYLRWLAVLLERPNGAGPEAVPTALEGAALGGAAVRAPRGPLAALLLTTAALVLGSAGPQLVFGLVS
jgi:NADH-quinone oxidoreductase subunit N